MSDRRGALAVPQVSAKHIAMYRPSPEPKGGRGLGVSVANHGAFDKLKAERMIDTKTTRNKETVMIN